MLKGWHSKQGAEHNGTTQSTLGTCTSAFAALGKDGKALGTSQVLVVLKGAPF